jgi:hypothetical protein
MDQSSASGHYLCHPGLTAKTIVDLLHRVFGPYGGVETALLRHDPEDGEEAGGASPRAISDLPAKPTFARPILDPPNIPVSVVDSS